MRRTIEVTGTGSVTSPPDMAIIDVGVEVLGRTVAGARAKAAADASAVIASLKDNGVQAADLATTAFAVHPDYDHGNGRRVRGYRASSTVEARLRDLDSIAAIIDAVVAAGSDSTVIHGLRFAHQEPAPLEDSARAAAWDDALHKATQLAELAGVGLGAAVAISEQGDPPPMPQLRTMALESAAASPIEAGELAVSVVIAVEFAIE